MNFYEIIIQANQSIYDIAIQQYGHVDHVSILLEDNPAINHNDPLLVGNKLQIREDVSVLDEETKKYFIDNNKDVATTSNGVTGPSYTPGSSVCADGTANVKDSAGALIVSASIPSGVPTDVTVPDITHTDSDGSPVVLKAQVPMVCTLSTPQPYYKSQTGSTIINGAGDDASRQQSGDFDSLLLDYWTLNIVFFPSGNTHGTMRRWTGNLGYWDDTDGLFYLHDGTLSTKAATFADNTLYDHVRKKAMYLNRGGSATFDAARTNAEAASWEGHTDWHQPTLGEWNNFFYFGDQTYQAFINAALFNFTGQCWTSTPHPATTTNAFIINTGSAVANISTKTNARYTIYIRDF